MVDIEHLQFGLETFGDIVANEDGSLQTAAASIRQIVREGQLADELGIQVFRSGRTSSPGL